MSLESLRNIPQVPPSRQRQQTVNRARELIDATMSRYEWAKRLVKSGQSKFDQSVNLVCFVGGKQFDVYSLASRDGDLIEIKGEFPDGSLFAVITPVEQVSFLVLFTKVTSKEPPPPPREIGFHAIPSEDQKQS